MQSIRLLPCAAVISIMLVVGSSESRAQVTDQQLIQLLGDPITTVFLRDEDFGEEGRPLEIRRPVVECIRAISNTNTDFSISVDPRTCRRVLSARIADPRFNSGSVEMKDLETPAMADRVDRLSKTVNAEAMERRKAADRRYDERRLAARQTTIDERIAEARNRLANLENWFGRLDAACSMYKRARAAAIPFLSDYDALFKHPRLTECADGYQMETKTKIAKAITKLEALEPRLGDMFLLTMPSVPGPSREQAELIMDGIQTRTIRLVELVERQNE